MTWVRFTEDRQVLDANGSVTKQFKEGERYDLAPASCRHWIDRFAAEYCDPPKSRRAAKVVVPPPKPELPPEPETPPEPEPGIPDEGAGRPKVVHKGFGRYSVLSWDLTEELASGLSKEEAEEFVEGVD